MVKMALIILIVLVGIIAVGSVGAVMLELYIRRRATARLRRLFGPEYKRVLDRYGDQRKAEMELVSREKRVEKVAIRPLTVEAKGGLSMKKQISNIDRAQSAWRRVKKDIKDAIIRDLTPLKEVKGAGGVKGNSKSTTGGTGTTGSKP